MLINFPMQLGIYAVPRVSYTRRLDQDLVAANDSGRIFFRTRRPAPNCELSVAWSLSWDAEPFQVFRNETQ